MEVWPHLKGVFSARDVSITMVRLLIVNLEVLLELVDKNGAETVLMPSPNASDLLRLEGSFEFGFVGGSTHLRFPRVGSSGWH